MLCRQQRTSDRSTIPGSSISRSWGSGKKFTPSAAHIGFCGWLSPSYLTDYLPPLLVLLPLLMLPSPETQPIGFMLPDPLVGMVIRFGR